MTLEEFKRELGAEADTLTQKEVEAYYNLSVTFFNVCFEKWKKETLQKNPLNNSDNNIQCK